MRNRTMLVGGFAALAALVFAIGPKLKLKPGTIGSGASAAWEAVSSGDIAANHVLVLEKFVPTSEWEAAGADIQQISGTPLSSLTGLAWDNLTPSTAGGGSPRWDVYYGPANGTWEGYMFLEPSVSDTNNDGVIDANEIAANPFWVYRAPQPGDVIKYLQVIVDEQERVVLDNITVKIGDQTTVFSGPGKSN